MRTLISLLTLLAVSTPASALFQAARLAVARDEYEKPPDPPPARPESTHPLSADEWFYPADPSPPGEAAHLPNVYLHSGEFHLSAEDLRIRGRGLDFVWARKYRSRLGPTTALGHGWDFSYNVRVESVPPGIRWPEVPPGIRLHDGNTRADVYRRRSDERYTRAGFFREGRFWDDGTFRLEFPNRGKWIFFPLDGRPGEGKIQRIQDRNGNAISFEYDTLGRLLRITDTLGREILVAYDQDGWLASVTDFLGRQVVYDHYEDAETGGSSGDLRSVRSPVVTGTPRGNDFPDGKTTVYSYSKGFSDDRLNHNLLTITDPKGHTWLRNSYHDTAGPGDPDFDRITRQREGSEDPIDIRWFPEVPPFTLPRGEWALVIVNDRDGEVCESAYDGQGRCIRRREYTGRADPDEPTTKTENRPGAPLRPGDPPFFETRYVYNWESQLIRKIHSNGNVTEWVYESSPSSRLQAVNVREVHRLPGSHTPVGDQTSLSEYFEYLAGFGGPSFITLHEDAKGTQTACVYDANGSRTESRYFLPGVRHDFEYDTFGRMTSHTFPQDQEGRRRRDQFTYWGPGDGPANGYLRSHAVDVAGLALTRTLEPDAVGNVVREIDPRGNDRLFVYNQLDQVVREQSRVVFPGQVPARYETDYFHDANDNLVRVDVLNVDGIGQIPSNTHFSKFYDYDVMNHLVRKTEEVDEARNVVTEYEYDAEWKLALVRYGEATNGNQPRNVVRFHYDERDLLYQQVRAEGDPLQSSSQWDYDGNRNIVRVLEGLEGTPVETLMTFDAYDRRLFTTDPMGNVEERHYDGTGMLTQLIVRGELSDEEGSLSNVRLSDETFEYDEMGRMTRRAAAHFDPQDQSDVGDGLSSTDYAYDPASLLTSITDDGGHVTGFSYDTAHRLVQETDAVGNDLLFDYDENSNVLARTEILRSSDPTQDRTYVTQYGYDAEDRHRSTTDNGGNAMQFHLDSRGNRVHMTDARSNETLLRYDGLGRLGLIARDMNGNGPSESDAEDIVTEQAWDDSSRLVSQTDDNGQMTRYEYDPLGRVTETRYADGTAETYTHDVHDDRISVSDPNGNQVATSFDKVHRPVGVSVVPGPGVSPDTTFELFEYDGLSRLVRAEDDDSLVTRRHDSLSNLLSETQNGKIFPMVHDGLGNRLEVTYPGGQHLSMAYDAIRRQVSVNGDSIIATWDYVGPRVERRSYPVPGAESLYQYDDAGRLTRARHSIQGSVVSDWGSDYDPMGNRTVMQALHSGGHRDYGYDPVHRLTLSRKLNPFGGVLSQSGYTFDGVGNRLRVSGDVDPGLYSSAPGDFEVNQYTETPFDARTYDENGNLEEITSGAFQDFVYDYRDRLVSYQAAGAAPTEYGYDALGRRTAATSGARSKRFYYVDWQVCEERDESDAIVAEYVYRMGVGPTPFQYRMGVQPQPFQLLDDVLMMRRGGTEYFYFEDPHGSTRLVSDALGAIAETYEYQDFGLPSFFDGLGRSISRSQIGNPYLFTRRRFDEESKLYHYRTRNLDPRAGRFTTRDTIGIWGDFANAGNGFTYTANNPHTWVDPDGRGILAALDLYLWYRNEQIKDMGFFYRYHDVTISVVKTGRAGNPNPEDGTGEGKGDFDSLLALLKQKGGRLQKRVVLFRTPVGQLLSRRGKGIGPLHNPGEMGLQEEVGGSFGGGFAPNAGNLQDQLMDFANKAQGSLKTEGFAFLPGPFPGGGLWVPRPSDGGGGSNPGKKERQHRGFFGEDMPGPPELVNPPPVPQRSSFRPVLREL